MTPDPVNNCPSSSLSQKSPECWILFTPTTAGDTLSTTSVICVETLTFTFLLGLTVFVVLIWFSGGCSYVSEGVLASCSKPNLIIDGTAMTTMHASLMIPWAILSKEFLFLFLVAGG